MVRDGRMKARLGRYVFLRKLATGGMAEIFLARRISFGGFAKFVIVKRLHPDLKGHPAYERLFLAEAHICSTLNHPNVISVHDVGKLDDIFFIGMEYVDGLSVAELMRYSAQQQLPIPLAISIRVGAGIAAALHHAHHTLDFRGDESGIIHHDVSPTNILLSFQGEVKLLDFGIATRVGKPVAGGRRGKLGYMSPEAMRRQPIDHRSDQYALAVVLYEMTCGRRLHRGRDREAGGEPLDQAPPTLPTQLDPSYPRTLESAILRGLAPDPTDRYPTCRAFQYALLKAAKELTADVSANAMATYLRALFGARIAKRHARLAELARQADDATRTRKVKSDAPTHATVPAPDHESRSKPAHGSASMPPSTDNQAAIEAAVDGSMRGGHIAGGLADSDESPVEPAFTAAFDGPVEPESRSPIDVAALDTGAGGLQEETIEFEDPIEDEEEQKPPLDDDDFGVPAATIDRGKDWRGMLTRKVRIWQQVAAALAVIEIVVVAVLWIALGDGRSEPVAPPNAAAASLTVISHPPGALVSIDGQALGPTPLTTVDVAVGRVVDLRLTHPAYPPHRQRFLIPESHPNPFVVVSLMGESAAKARRNGDAIVLLTPTRPDESTRNRDLTPDKATADLDRRATPDL